MRGIPLPRKHPILWWGAWAAITALVCWAGVCIYTSRDRILHMTQCPTQPIVARVVARPQGFALSSFSLPMPVDVIAVVTDKRTGESWELKITSKDTIDDARRDFRSTTWMETVLWLAPGDADGVDVLQRKLVKEY